MNLDVMIKYLMILFLIPMIFFITYGQEIGIGFDTELIEKYTKALSELPSPLEAGTGVLSSSVNQDEYIVDSGDNFIIKIDIPGPTVKIYQSIVSPDGYILLPDVKSIMLKNQILRDAREIVKKSLKRQYPDSIIEVYLFQIHPISVNVLGAVVTEGRQNLFSSSRLFDAIQIALEQKELSATPKIMDETKTEFLNLKTSGSDKQKIDSISVNEENKRDYRRVKIIRQGVSNQYDLLRFKILGDMHHNPYLMNDDVIILSYRESNENSIEVNGAVINPIEFSYRPGDSLGLALDFSGGLLPSADSSHLEIYRFSTDRVSILRLIMDYDTSSGFLLRSDDRIIVRHKRDFQSKQEVEIKGEVLYPGYYPIQEGKVQLSDVIKMAGGLKKEADLKMSMVIRSKHYPNDPEINRLSIMAPIEMDEIEKSYFQLRIREDLRVVNTDFEKLFENNDMNFDVVLKDKDIIYLPKSSNIVYVSGAVIKPGNFEFYPDWTISDYIRAAGGFSNRARKKSIKIIKYKTGNWLDTDRNMKLEQGDMIFIPEKPEKDLWSNLREVLTVSAQVGAIVAIIISLSRY